MAEGRDYPVEYAVNLSLDEDTGDDDNDDDGDGEGVEGRGSVQAMLLEELKQRLRRYHLPSTGPATFQQLNAQAAIAAAHQRAYIQVRL
jgi:hypothetical protein